MNRMNLDFSAHSALFRAMKNMIVIHDDFVFRVKSLERRHPSKDINITRLKRAIFNEIQRLFNFRIQSYNLLYPPITDDEIAGLSIHQIVVKKDETQEDDVYAGRVELYPLVFMCDICGDFREISSQDLQYFDTKCCVQGCNGNYRQLSLLRYCRECGKVEHFRYWCRAENDRSLSQKYTEHPIQLLQPSKDALFGWKFRCKTCGWEKDIFDFSCDHFDQKAQKKISDKPPTKFDPLTIREGGVFQPIVKTYVSIEPLENEKILEEEELLIAVGYHLGMFSFLEDILKRSEGEAEIMSFKQVKNLLSSLRNLKSAGLIRSEQEKVLDQMESVLENLKTAIGLIGTRNLDEFLTIKDLTMPRGDPDDIYSRFVKDYEGHLESSSLPADKKEEIRNKYKRMCGNFGIQNITYIPEIKLVSAYIGYIKGPFPRDGVPHFEPIWIDERKKFDVHERNFEAYIHPYNTEGILVEFNPLKIVSWLRENGFDELRANNESEARKLLVLLREESDDGPYNMIFRLLHTFSHAFMMNASTYCGLDTDSLGEIIFPSATAVMIYSTSVINIGGLQYMFENNLPEVLEDMRNHIQECIYDPVCSSEGGACFACMYLPEYVCGYLNQTLDRRIFTGSESLRGFWEHG
ncbi:DUF1998 domain-containing protein [Archaeoglobus neptunius]|uniref:DUF1998 domain-containing protein n=1 Tax=Archaeoglobus neptunius TaxID=2798580 RepID=UPI001927B044|nr:DUF1998 domain-containing protein [Archaeoglobus neptunius]